jgi:hypothetical protein
MLQAPSTPDAFYPRLLGDTFPDDLSDGDAHLVFVILHYYRVVLSRPQLLAEYASRPDVNVQVVFGPLEPRRCAEALASLWSDRVDLRAEPSHWLLRWQGEWGSYTRLRRLSPAELGRLRELLGKLGEHPFVGQLIADGSQPFENPVGRAAPADRRGD